MKDIEKEAIARSLNELSKKGIITEEQRKILLDIYKNEDRNYAEVRKEVDALSSNKELLEKVLKRSKEAKGLEDVELKKEKKHEVNLSLENITDFEKDGKDFIKIHYPYPIDEVRIIENRTNPHRSSKEIFESLKDKPWLTSLDGTSNATAIFEQILIKECREVNINRAEELSKVSEFDKLKTEEKEVVLGTLKTLISNADLSDEDK